MLRADHRVFYGVRMARLLLILSVLTLPGHVMSAPMTSEQIDALWDFSKPETSRQRFEEALAKWPESADELRTQIARTYSLTGKFEEARQELARIEGERSPVVRVRYELEMGRILNSSGNREAARPHFKRALKVAKESNLDFYEVDAAHMLGIVTTGQESIQWNEAAIKLAEGSFDARAKGWAGSLLNNLAWTYHDLGEFEKALVKFQAALEFRQRGKNEEATRVAKWSVARCLRSLKRFEEALVLQRELEKGPADGYVWEELGELLFSLERAEESKPYFRKAFEALSKDEWLVKNESARIARLKELDS